jgi:hypothetical protein
MSETPPKADKFSGWIDPRKAAVCGPSKLSVSGYRVGWRPSALAIVAIWARWRSIIRVAPRPPVN